MIILKALMAMVIVGGTYLACIESAAFIMTRKNAQRKSMKSL